MPRETLAGSLHPATECPLIAQGSSRGCGFVAHATSLPRRVFSVRLMSKSGTPRRSSRGGMARRKAQDPYGSCLAARGRLAARQSRRFPATGPAFVRSVAHPCADRAVSQLLAGTPSGPGGSSAAARVPCCDKTRRRRTSSRFTTPHDRAPQWTRWTHDTRGSGGGSWAGIAHPVSSSRRKPGSRGNQLGTSGSGYRLSPV